MRTKRVEILYFAGCPNVELANARASEAIRMVGLSARVSLVEITDADDALAQRFLGSPTVRVDGIDVEPGARDRADFGLQCRVYPAGDRIDGAPPVDWISAALRGGVVEAGKAGAEQPPSIRGCCSPDPPSHR